ncbi:MAG: hypothetical protein JNG83_03780, partial [Opitutaceae bacterium]|nr:hypothetical protein [Opitutaceae bacterium]
TGKWRPLAPLPQAVRGLSVVAIDAGRLYLAGGYANDQFSAQGLIYDIATDRYLPAVALPYAAMVTLLPCGEYLYCLGGEDRAKHRSAAAYRIPLSAVAR